MRCSIIPPYLLARLATLAPDHRMALVAAAAKRALADQDHIHLARAAAPRYPDFGEGAASNRRSAAAAASAPHRTIYDAGFREVLPGSLVRAEGAAAVSDIGANEAYDGLGATWNFYWDAYRRNSIDGAGLPLDGTVHYGEDYDNAFWDGERMVFGDGDGQVFRRFTSSLSVIGHELTHGVTQFTANLEYQGQSGALNESISDVFGVLVDQHSQGQTVETASWLVGPELFTDEVQGEALRSMKAPGTAYDDDVLGKDPQPAHMSEYVETRDDSGGVHLNSGIPNRAFYLASAHIGGKAWEGAGQIWYDTITSGRLSPRSDFAAFASETSASAITRFGAESTEATAVATAWKTVGVEVK